MHAALLDALPRDGRVLLTGPIAPDGDSLGASLALQRVLRQHGLIVDVAGEAGFRYAWMPGAAELLDDAAVRADYAAVVVLDGDRHRLAPGADAAFRAAPVKAIVDHHASTTTDGYDVAWLEPTAASTCEMLFNALPSWGVALDRDLASLLYTGLVFDTGGFRYSNTTPATHRMAGALLAAGVDHVTITARVMFERRYAGLRLMARVAADAVVLHDGRFALGQVTAADREALALEDGDLEGLVDMLLHLQGVQASCLVIERPDGRCKLSLRSRTSLDVAKLAQSLTTAGGGHAKAAGASLDLGLAEARAAATAAFGAALGAQPGAR